MQVAINEPVNLSFIGFCFIVIPLWVLSDCENFFLNS